MATAISVAQFEPIHPAPARDIFAFDFTSQLPTSEITGVTWTCTVASSSPVIDPTPEIRLIGSPVFDAHRTSQLVGDMVDGVTYVLTVEVNTSDSRILFKSGEVVCLLEPKVEPLPALPPGAIRFDYDQFIAGFPEFEGVSVEKMQSLWDRAGLIFRNDDTSPAQDEYTRRIILNVLTAHLAQIYSGPGSASSLVGRINSKSVNGVSVSAEGFGITGTMAWYLTTRYGSDFWRLTAAYRTMHYIPGPQRFPNPVNMYGRGVY